MVRNLLKRTMPVLKPVLTLVMSLALAGCINDSTLIPDGPDGGDPGDGTPDLGQVQITVTVPRATTPTATRSISDDGGEATVEEIDVLVFRTNPTPGAPDLLTERVSGSDIVQSDSGTDRYAMTFLAKLTIDPNASRVVVIANASDRVDAALASLGANPVGSKKPDVLDALTLAISAKWNANPTDVANPTAGTHYTPIPMYGEATFTGGVKPDIRISGIELVRMLARIDITTASTANITIEKIHVQSRSNGYIAPPWDANGNTASSSTPKIPTGQTDLSPFVYTPATNNLTGEIYVMESAATIGGDSSRTGTETGGGTYIIIEGKITGNPVTYFWRIDLTDQTDTSGRKPGDPGYVAPEAWEVKYMPALRNRLYKINISHVEGAGYNNYTEAAQSSSVLSNLKTTILTVDPDGINNINFDGQYWLGLERVEEWFPAGGGTSATGVGTDYPAGWEFDTSVHTAGIEYVAGGTGWLTATKESGDPQTSGMNFVAKAHTGTDREALIHIRAGRVRHKVKVVQVVPLFTVSQSAGAYDFGGSGGPTSVDVTSRIAGTVDAGGTIPASDISWVVEFSSDAGNTWSDQKPDWLTFPTGDTGGALKTYPMGAAAFSPFTDNAEDKALNEAPDINTASGVTPWNLASDDGTTTVETANTYIVNAPGTYSLPPIYGNAFKEGQPNPGSYTYKGPALTTAQLPNVMETFFKHDNYAITSHTIAGGASAKLLWMDTPGLVTNVKFADGMIQFDVPRAGISQGNAVVALFDTNNTILWSWQIWVTPLVDAAKPTTLPVTNATGVITDMMEYNIGYATPRTIAYGGGANHDEPRDLTIRLRQTGTTYPATHTLDIDQTTLTQTFVGTNTFYQYGRKDPFPAAYEGKATYERPLYYTDPAYKFVFGSPSPQLPNTYGYSIQNPYKHVGNNSSAQWMTGGKASAVNLWSANQNTAGITSLAPVVKTVYDPSPRGFSVPSMKAYSNFTLANSTGFTDGIRHFHLDPATPGATIALPATGRRNYNAGSLIDQPYLANGTPVTISNYGGFYAAVERHSGGVENYSLSFDGGTASYSVNPTNSNQLGNALSIRPVKETLLADKRFIPAPPGVIGIRASDYNRLVKARSVANDPALLLADIDLTLRGSSTYAGMTQFTNATTNTKYGPLEQEPVYTVYYMWGSTIAIIGGENDTWSSDGSDVVWVNPEFTTYGTAGYSWATAQTWSAITSTTAGGFNEGNSVTSAPTKGHGDPCAYVGDGSWRTPTRRDWITSAGFPGMNIHLYPGSDYRWTNANPIEDIPAHATYLRSSEGSTTSLVAAGSRQGGVGAGLMKNQNSAIAYWSSTNYGNLPETPHIYDATYFLSTDTSLGMITSTFRDTAMPVRCFENFVVTPRSLEFEGTANTLAEAKSVTISTEDTWTVSTTAPWIAFDLATGTGNATIKVYPNASYPYDSANPDTPRTATLTLTSGKGATRTVTISQKQVPPPYPQFMLASPGVIGIKDSDYRRLTAARTAAANPALLLADIKLTIQGSSTYAGYTQFTNATTDAKYGPLEDEPVYTVNFLWGSLFGRLLSQNPIDGIGDLWSTDGSDIVWKNSQYTGSTAVPWNTVKTNWMAKTNGVTGTTNEGKLTIQNLPAGHGDPCNYVGNGAWHTPTRREWLDLLGGPGTAASKVFSTANGDYKWTPRNLETEFSRYATFPQSSEWPDFSLPDAMWSDDNGETRDYGDTERITYQTTTQLVANTPPLVDASAALYLEPTKSTTKYGNHAFPWYFLPVRCFPN
ncbi:MAG: BACON domain-containing protein [Alistipes sp.]|nr:BACON domain-containing protein [Alistipes sp.]